MQDARDPTDNPSRRRLITGGSAALLAGAAIATRAAASPVGGDDAELLRLCAEFHRQHAAVDGWPHGDAEGFNAALDLRWQISDLIEAIVPGTDAGQRAKAAVGAMLLTEEPGQSRHADFALATLRDIAGPALPAAAAGVPSHPDAEILRLFAEWLPLRRRFSALADFDTTLARPEIDHELRDVLVPAMHVLAEKIADLRANTLEGLRAKATVLLSYTGYHADGERPLWTNHDELMGWSIAHDLLGDAAWTPEFLA